MGVNNRRGGVPMSKVDLELPEVFTSLQQVRGVRMPQGVNMRMLGDATGLEGEAESALECGAAHGLRGSGGTYTAAAFSRKE